jgi:hypothetical protein
MTLSDVTRDTWITNCHAEYVQVLNFCSWHEADLIRISASCHEQMRWMAPTDGI